LSRPFFDAGTHSQAEGSGNEGPNLIREFFRIGSMFAHQGTDPGRVSSQAFLDAADLHVRKGLVAGLTLS
jgi:hypothetical protein